MLSEYGTTAHTHDYTKTEIFIAELPVFLHAIATSGVQWCKLEKEQNTSYNLHESALS